MESERFDRLTRAWSTQARRRTVLGALLSGAFGLAPLTESEASGKKRKAASEGKKGKSKTIDLCLNGQTMTVKKSKKRNMLKRGATQGACPGSPPASPPAAPPSPPPPVSMCRDGIKNGQETDVDCGGPLCPACGNGKTCNHAIECFGGVCNGTNRCGVCTKDADCRSDFNGSCLCDIDSGNCFSDLEPTQFVDSCGECDPALVCASFSFPERLACLPRCASSEICAQQDFCSADDFTSCSHGGLCFQPLGGGRTRCGVSAMKCGCGSHQECANEFGEGAFCAQFNPAAGPCTCGAGSPHTTFCARRR